MAATIIPIRGARPKIEPAMLETVNGGHAIRGLTPQEVAYLRDELAPIRAVNELRRIHEAKERLQERVMIAALLVGWFCLIFFAFQVGRAGL